MVLPFGGIRNYPDSSQGGMTIRAVFAKESFSDDCGNPCMSLKLHAHRVGMKLEVSFGFTSLEIPTFVSFMEIHSERRNVLGTSEITPIAIGPDDVVNLL